MLGLGLGLASGYMLLEETQLPSPNANPISNPNPNPNPNPKSDRCEGLSNGANQLNMGVQQSLDQASSPRSIKLQMACFCQYIECTPSWLSSVACMYATILLECAASVDVDCILLVVEFSNCSTATTTQWLLGSSWQQHSFVPSNRLTGNNQSGCAAFIHPTRSYPRFNACSNGLSWLIQHLFTRL